jgi:hypothetical protein
MKRTIFAIITTIGLIAPALTYAANSIGNGNTVYERDLAVWNGAGQDIKAAQKLHFGHNNIYERDLAVWNGAGQGIKVSQKLQFEYNKIYEHDFTAWNGTGQGIKVSQRSHFEYDNIYERDLAAGNNALTGKINPLVASIEHVAGVEIAAATEHEALLFGVDSYGADQTFWWNSELVTAFA